MLLVIYLFHSAFHLYLVVFKLIIAFVDFLLFWYASTSVISTNFHTYI